MYERLKAPKGGSGIGDLNAHEFYRIIECVGDEMQREPTKCY